MLFLMGLLVSITTTFATSLFIEASIYQIDYGKTASDEPLIYLSTGQIAHISKEQRELSEFEKARKNNSLMRIELDENFLIKNWKYLILERNLSQKRLAQIEEENFTPSILESIAIAQDLFQKGRYVNKDSQCYNRAHIWSYEWFLKHSINTSKTWLFFTRKYIRKYKFNWWFHVSPSVKVLDEGEEKEKIMDLKYTKGPTSLRQWTDIFMQNDAPCRMVDTYSDYANYPESTWCFTMRTSMYYYQPYDLEMKEIWGARRELWNESDLKQAYAEAFDE